MNATNYLTLQVECPCCKRLFLPRGRQKFCSAKCRQKSFYHGFKQANGICYKRRLAPPKPFQRYKIGSRNKISAGVYKSDRSYTAHISIANRIHRKSYSISRLGEKGARLAATFQRMAWMLEFGVWNPKDGDPFELLSYSESFSKNQDYENSVVKDMDSPAFRGYGDEEH